MSGYADIDTLAALIEGSQSEWVNSDFEDVCVACVVGLAWWLVGAAS